MIPALLLAQAAAAMHPVPAAPCTPDAVLPPALAFWKQPAAGTTLVPFRPVVLPVAPGVTPPGGKPGMLAGTTFTVAEAGAYTIAIGAPGWIDVFAATGGKPLASIAHAHGPSCTTIAKLVTFRFAPGRYRLALSGLAGDRVKVVLAPGSAAGADR